MRPPVTSDVGIGGVSLAYISEYDFGIEWLIAGTGELLL